MPSKKKDHEIKRAVLGSFLQKNREKRVFLVYGEEAFLRDQCIEMIQAHSVSHATGVKVDETGSHADDSDGLSREILYGDETDAREILSRVQEVPFFSSHQIVLLKWADKLPAREGEALIPYFSAPSDSTTLIISSAKELDGRLKWVKTLNKQAVVVEECKPLYENQRMSWVRREAERAGLRLDAEAAELLKELASEGMYRVRRELEKLSLYVSANKTINAHDVVAVQGAEPGVSVFDLDGAIIQGHVSRALLIVEKTLESGEAPLRILGALLWQYRRLWKAKDGLRRGNETAVANSLRVPAFRQREFVAMVKRAPVSHFPEAFQALSVTDRELKGGAAASPHRILHALIMRLCQSATSPSHAGR